MQRGDGRIFKQKRSPFLSISYYHGSTEQREVALHVRTGKKLLAAVDAEGKLINDANYHEAERYLKHRVGEVTTEHHGGPAFISPAKQRVTVDAILDALIAEFKAREILTSATISHLKPIRAEFGLWRAVDLAARPEVIDQYISRRRKLGKAKATVNRGTQLLGQAYQLAVESKTLTTVPRITRLSEADNVRQGFITEADFRRIYVRLPEYLQDYALFAYRVGWRKSAVASLRWVDVHGGRVWLRAEKSKNREPQDVPIEGELAEIITRRQVARKVVNTGRHHGAVRPRFPSRRPHHCRLSQGVENGLQAGGRVCIVPRPVPLRREEHGRRRRSARGWEKDHGPEDRRHVQPLPHRERSG